MREFDTCRREHTGVNIELDLKRAWHYGSSLGERCQGADFEATHRSASTSTQRRSSSVPSPAGVTDIARPPWSDTPDDPIDLRHDVSLLNIQGSYRPCGYAGSSLARCTSYFAEDRSE